MAAGELLGLKQHNITSAEVQRPPIPMLECFMGYANTGVLLIPSSSSQPDHVVTRCAMSRVVLEPAGRPVFRPGVGEVAGARGGFVLRSPPTLLKAANGRRHRGCPGSQ
ncbi:hypothetical protein EYF80_057654 [Liparis tanakae]|uniref:Uncharacterized protein n=1 Tax=Liparis tanakae TaxID=230148 RepID=A0A4Z2ETD7_9TELE|nr:hypothetical protein EYF80_057654 [Liparis tanakae]